MSRGLEHRVLLAGGILAPDLDHELVDRNARPLALSRRARTGATGAAFMLATAVPAAFAALAVCKASATFAALSSFATSRSASPVSSEVATRRRSGSRH